jgi:hypothetical protein
MAATATILDLVSIDYLTNTCVDWSNFFVAHWPRSSIFTIFHFSLNPIFHISTDNFPTRGHGTPCVALVFGLLTSMQRSCVPVQFIQFILIHTEWVKNRILHNTYLGTVLLWTSYRNTH